MDLFDYETLRATPLSRDPYEHVIVSGFVRPDALGKINVDYPAIEDTGSFPVEGLQFGPGFQVMVDALESEPFRKAFEEKFEVDLSGRPTTITVRGRCAGGDGQIHTDSVGKIITILIYLNPKSDDSGGRLRLLRAKNIEDVAGRGGSSRGDLAALYPAG